MRKLVSVLSMVILRTQKPRRISRKGSAGEYDFLGG